MRQVLHIVLLASVCGNVALALVLIERSAALSVFTKEQRRSEAENQHYDKLVDMVRGYQPVVSEDPQYHLADNHNDLGTCDFIYDKNWRYAQHGLPSEGEGTSVYTLSTGSHGETVLSNCVADDKGNNLAWLGVYTLVEGFGPSFALHYSGWNRHELYLVYEAYDYAFSHCTADKDSVLVIRVDARTGQENGRVRLAGCLEHAYVGNNFNLKFSDSDHFITLNDAIRQRTFVSPVAPR